MFGVCWFFSLEPMQEPFISHEKKLKAELFHSLIETTFEVRQISWNFSGGKLCFRYSNFPRQSIACLFFLSPTLSLRYFLSLASSIFGGEKTGTKSLFMCIISYSRFLLSLLFNIALFPVLTSFYTFRPLSFPFFPFSSSACESCAIIVYLFAHQW